MYGTTADEKVRRSAAWSGEVSIDSGFSRISPRLGRCCCMDGQQVVLLRTSEVALHVCCNGAEDEMVASTLRVVPSSARLRAEVGCSICAFRELTWAPAGRRDITCRGGEDVREDSR